MVYNAPGPGVALRTIKYFSASQNDIQIFFKEPQYTGLFGIRNIILEVWTLNVGLLLAVMVLDVWVNGPCGWKASMPDIVFRDLLQALADSASFILYLLDWVRVDSFTL